MKQRTCDELGVCQQRAECHLPCSGPPEPNQFPFAPGVIDVGPAPDLDATWPEILAATIIGAAIFAIVGFAAGYLKLPGWLL